MTTGVVNPDRDAFAEAARNARVIPVTRRLLADTETAVGLYSKLANRPGTFLLESAEPGRSWSRYSFIGVRSLATLTEKEGQARWLGQPPVGVGASGDPISAFRATVEALESPTQPGLPPLTGGLVGYLSYDVVRRFERLPAHGIDDLATPELAMMLVADLAVLDHHDGSVLLVANVFLPPEASESALFAEYDEAVRRLDAMTVAVSRPAPAKLSIMEPVGAPAFSSNTPSGGFAKAVEECKEAIRAGECFQIVPSQRFQTPTTADALDVYRVLRATNPSPYMYLLRYDGYDVVGSSPETHLKVTGRHARLRPIAGTRWRGETSAEDARLARELIEDPKERAEHVMLVDLARNDLGRVCRPGTVKVPHFMTIERYSHVMHIVSTVEGDLDSQQLALDALAATFPAGTLTGAPKVRAMEIIDALEPTRRGLYAGTVGYVDFAGDMDMAITIRTALLRDDMAYVQAGAGIVADSVPEFEETESRNKAAALLAAVAAAQNMRSAV